MNNKLPRGQRFLFPSPKEEGGRSQETDEERPHSDECPTVFRYVVAVRRLGHGVDETSAAAPGNREAVVALRTAACQDVAAVAADSPAGVLVGIVAAADVRIRGSVIVALHAARQRRIRSSVLR